MKRNSFVFSLIALVLLVGAFYGCDNRSQLEKDADAAAKKVSDALR